MQSEVLKQEVESVLGSDGLGPVHELKIRFLDGIRLCEALRVKATQTPAKGEGQGSGGAAAVSEDHVFQHASIGSIFQESEAGPGAGHDLFLSRSRSSGAIQCPLSWASRTVD